MIIFERNTEIENKIGLIIENLSFNVEKTNIEDQKIHIFGEYSIKNYEKYNYIIFEAIFYDENNYIIARNRTGESLSDFLGQGSFEILDFLPLEILNKISKIKLYPKSVEVKNKSISKDKITLDTDEMIIKIYIKKDYSLINSLNDRKYEFLEDINKIIGNFSDSEEFEKYLEHYD